MLTVTEDAGARLDNLLGGRDSVIRIVRRKRRLKLRRDRLRPNDETFAHNGRIVLVLDEKIAESLASRTLGIRQTATGPRLRLQRR